MSTKSEKIVKKTRKPVAKPTGPAGLRVGRLIEYNGEYGKVISLVTTVKAKILTKSGKELVVNRSDLKFASAASKKANAPKGTGKKVLKSAVEKLDAELPIKKTAARARKNKHKGVENPKADVSETVKKVPVKKVPTKEVPKIDPIQPAIKKPVGKVAPVKKSKVPVAPSLLKGSYKILRPEYVVLAFMDIYSDKSTLEDMIKNLNLYHIEFSFANITEGTNIDGHEEFQKQNNIVTERNQQIKRSILDFADPEKSGIATPHLENDMLVFKVSSAKDLWLLKLLETVRDKLAIDNIDTMVTMSIEDDGPLDSIVQNVLIIGFA